MYTTTVPYVGYDDVKRSKTLHFHLARNQAMEHLNLFEDIDEVQKIMAAPDHELSTHEKQLFVNLIRDVARISYGERLGEDRFRQNDEVWQAFRDSAAYDAWFFALFYPSAEEAFKFVMKVIPKHLMDEIQTELPKDDAPSLAQQEGVDPDTEAFDKAEFERWKAEQKNSQ